MLRVLATNADDGWPGAGVDAWPGLVATNGTAAAAGAPELAAANGWPASLASSTDGGWSGVGVGAGGWPATVVKGAPEAAASGWPVVLLAEGGRAGGAAPSAGAVEPAGGAAKGWLSCATPACHAEGAPAPPAKQISSDDIRS